MTRDLVADKFKSAREPRADRVSGEQADRNRETGDPEEFGRTVYAVGSGSAPNNLGKLSLTVHFIPNAPQSTWSVLFSRQFPTNLGPADSTVIRTSDTNRVGPLSLAQGNERDFLFSPLGPGNSQLSEPVDERLLPDAPLIQLVC